jgi:DinB superfamily
VITLRRCSTVHLLGTDISSAIATIRPATRSGNEAVQQSAHRHRFAMRNSNSSPTAFLAAFLWDTGQNSEAHMSRENPYADYLGGQEPLKVLPVTARKIEVILEQLGAERVDQSPAPGKWTAREIVCHLADCEIAFAFRLRQTLGEENHVIQPFDQGKWAANYSGYDARDALTTFHAARNWNLALIRSLSPEAQQKPVMHPERGAMTFHTIVETMGGHDINHLRQLEGIVKQFAPEHSALSGNS